MHTGIDLNCDMGESFGVYKLGFDEDIIKHVSSVNIACGFHAGDPMWMRHTVQLAEKHNVAVGAHPSFPDFVGFGRRDMIISADEAKADLIYQIGALQAFTKEKKIQHVKPHGAMYNRAVNDETLARAICEAVLEVDPHMILVAMAGSRWSYIAKEMGLRVAREAFADRILNDDGTLVSRSNPRAVIHDIQQVEQQGLGIITKGMATSITGNDVEVQADTLCLHGDTPGAVNMASTLRQKIESEGIPILPLNKLI